MTDVADVEVLEFDADGVAGVAVVPASETKKVVIPSPPSVRDVPINPRPAIIWLTDAEITDKVKAYAKRNGVVLVVPEKAEAGDLYAVYEYVFTKAAKFNVKKGEISVASDSANANLAADLVAVMSDEDVDVDDAAELTI